MTSLSMKFLASKICFPDFFRVRLNFAIVMANNNPTFELEFLDDFEDLEKVVETSEAS